MKDDIEKLAQLKKDVLAWFEYWNENIAIYHKSARSIFYEMMTREQKDALNSLQRPALEFNVLEAYVSRLIGEFSKQEPNFEVRESPDSDGLDPRLIGALEGYLSAITQDSKKEGTETEIYKDMICCSYSVAEVFYEYVSSGSFSQNIKFRKVADPTMCGFDPLAQEKHKGDGRFYFRVFPMTEEDFKNNYPDVDTCGLSYSTTSVGKFSFSYRSKNEKIIAVCSFYEKIKTRKKIVYLSNDVSMSQSAYNKMIKEWDNQGIIEQTPKIIKSRISEFTDIQRIDFIENQILSTEKTSYTELPGAFFDGNSVKLRFEEGKDDLTQRVRPYWKNAEGAQQLKNLAGQVWANELESLVSHKFMLAKEGIPPQQFVNSYINTQKASVMVYNAFLPDGTTPIPPPMPVQRQPIPPEIPGAFVAADQAIQNSLGSYDAQLGINESQLSGVAIVEAATQSNAAAMPYIVNYMTSFNHLAKIIIGLIPRILKNPRKIPIVDEKNKKQYIEINSQKPNSISMKFDPMSLSVTVQAGTNFEVQKNKSLQMLDMLSKSFVSMQQLINTKGLPVLLDNMSFRGVEQLKQYAEEMMKIQEAQQAKVQQQGQQQPNPLQLKEMELQLKSQQMQINQQIEQQKIQQSQLELALKMHMQGSQDAIDVAKMKTEEAVNREKSEKDFALASAKINSDHILGTQKNAMETINQAAKIAEGNQSFEEPSLTSSQGEEPTNIPQ